MEEIPTFAARWHPRPSGWTVAAVLGSMTVLCALVLAGELSSDRADTVPVAVDVVAAMLALILVPVLLRRPVPAAAVLAALAAVSPTLVPPSTAATVVVARTRSLPTAVLLAAAGAAGHVARGAWRPLPGLSFGWWVLLVLAVHAALLAWGALAQARAGVLIGLAERARRAEADRDAVVGEALAAERARLAREMHDVLAHRLSLLATYAGAIEFRPDASPRDLAHAAGVVRSETHQALEELRDVIGVLRADPEDAGVPRPAPSLDRLAALVGESRNAGTVVDLFCAVAGEPPGIIGRTAYRVVQEGLTNARKHAPGRAVVVRVTGAAGEGVTVTVTNPLGGLPAHGPPGSGTGLVGLAERVRIVGGRLTSGSSPDGFELSAWLPWQS